MLIFDKVRTRLYNATGLFIVALARYRTTLWGPKNGAELLSIVKITDMS